MYPASRQSTYFILILLVLFYCLDFFYQITPGLVVHQLISQYNISPLGIGLFVSSFYCGYTLFQIPAGILLDKASVKTCTIIAIFVCTTSFYVFIFGHSFSMGCLVRFFNGIASSFAFISVLYVARVYLPEQYFSMICVPVAAIGTLVSSFVQIIAAFLIHHFNWHLVLSIFPLCGITVALILVHPKLRLQAAVITGDDALRVDTLGVIFLRLKKIFLMPRIWVNSIIGGLFYLPTSLLATAWGVSFFAQAYQVKSTSSSTLILMLFVGWAIGSPLVGWLGQRVKAHKYIFILFAIIAALISYGVLFHVSLLHDKVYLSMVLFGFFSSAQLSIWKTFSEICCKEMSAIGIAFTNVLMQGTVAIFHVVVGSLIQHAYAKLHVFTPQVYLHGLALIPAFFLVSALLLLLSRQ